MPQELWSTTLDERFVNLQMLETPQGLMLGDTQKAIRMILACFPAFWVSDLPFSEVRSAFYEIWSVPSSQTGTCLCTFDYAVESSQTIRIDNALPLSRSLQRLAFVQDASLGRNTDHPVLTSSSSWKKHFFPDPKTMSHLNRSASISRGELPTSFTFSYSGR
jgi:hypothetical protein